MNPKIEKRNAAVDEQTVPKLRPMALSGYIADLILVGLGEAQAVHHRSTRSAWHVLFFSSILLVIWHFTIRVAVVPSLIGSIAFAQSLRLMETFAYGYLLVVLCIVAGFHYRNVLLPGSQPRFVSLCFFFLYSIVLFARLTYSLLNYSPDLFKTIDTTTVAAHHFGLFGAGDFKLFVECLNYSVCTMMNRSYTGIEPASLVTSCISTVEALAGYVFFAVLIGTFVQVSSHKVTKK